MRITIASVKTEMAIAGMMNSWRFATGSSRKRMNESDGTQWNTREVKSSNSVASQKFGMLIPTRPATREL